MLRIHDALTGRTGELAPGRAVRLHTCTPASAEPSGHLGDLRPHVLADVIRRLLESRRVRVVACRGPLPGGDAAALGAFRRVAGALNLRPPEHEPLADEAAEAAVELIAGLVERGRAHLAPDGSVRLGAPADDHPAPPGAAASPSAAASPGAAASSGAAAPSGHAAPSGGPALAGGEGRSGSIAQGGMTGAQGAPAGGGVDPVLWAVSGGEPAWDSPWGRGAPAAGVRCQAAARRSLGARVDILVAGGDAPSHGDEPLLETGHVVAGGPVRFDGPALSAEQVTEAGLDPLAVRLAYLEHHYREPVHLTWDLLRDADREVRRWRARVAGWAESPSAPLSSGYVERVEAALDDDLDTPAALRTLRDLDGDDSVAAGAKFESFLHLDQVLALDLSAEIGRAPAPTL